ncbi:37S ribosomal protein S24 [Drechslerella dactyloides]|uniref:37S ribosomal protein S24 n=1 Tax=Drechslerella dactyloides TaxID=74499 RepID=A0AAD6NHW2_DREDA|nr:37S ribosomal protein S24 [Drechslerella dactyloides]
MAVLASLCRTSYRPCGLLVPSANFPPRPIYRAQALQQIRRNANLSRDDDEDYDDHEDLEERNEPAEYDPYFLEADAEDVEEPLIPKYSEAEVRVAREKLGLSSQEDPVPTVQELFKWPKDHKDNDDEMYKEYHDLPWVAKKALKIPNMPKVPNTAEHLFGQLSFTDNDLERIAGGARTWQEPKYRSRGLVRLQDSDFTPEDEEGMADLSDLNTLIGDDRFSESEIINIMVDETEPENDIILLRRMIEITERDMAQDIVRLKQHEEDVLKEEIKMRIGQGLTPQQAEHDARAVMRLPQKRTQTRQEVSRDLSDEAIAITETLSNDELEQMGVKGRRAIMRNLHHRSEWESRPLKPTREEAMEMFPTAPSGMEGEDAFDPHIWDWNATDISSMAHAELEEHREARKYARLAVYDMPRLSSFAKPFQIPTASEVLRFRYTTYMGVEHPGENKVVMECCPQDLNLTPVQTDKLIKICGPRYNPTRKILKFSSEMFSHQHQNKRYLSELMDKLIAEAKACASDAVKAVGMLIEMYLQDDTDTFEDVPFDFRHHKFHTPKSFPKEWRMTPDKLQMKRLKDWQKHATPQEMGRLRTYLYNRAQEKKQKTAAVAGGIDLASVETAASNGEPLSF